MNIKEILKKHEMWLKNDIGGERANLCGINLCGVNLYGIDLRGADLSGTNLCGAILHRANLHGVNLWGANLHGADLGDANLYGANLCDANLCNANLRDAKNVDELKWSIYTAFYPLQCPEEGEYIAWKKAHNKIVKLKITEKAKRSSATSRKCRASEALVLDIQSIDGAKHFDFVSSDRDDNFVYRIGEIVQVDDFDEDRWNECSNGIHHFITREEAVKYN